MKQNSETTQVFKFKTMNHNKLEEIVGDFMYILRVRKNSQSHKEKIKISIR